MIVTQTEIDQILSARTRLRVLRLPVRYGAFGERKRCPVRVGHAYRLRSSIPHAAFRRQAEGFASRAHGVLWLIDECERPRRTVTITVVAVEKLGVSSDAVWVVRFTKGDATDHVDKPRLLTARSGTSLGDYTSITARAMRGEKPAVPESYQTHLNQEARARDAVRDRGPIYGRRRRLVAEINDLEAGLPALERSLADAASDKDRKELQKALRSRKRMIRSRRHALALIVRRHIVIDPSGLAV